MDFDLSAIDIGSWVSHYLWPLFRIGGFFMVVPFIGNRLVPGRVRLLLAMLTTLLVAPVLPPLPAFEPLSLNTIITVLQQLLIGASLGFCIQMMFHVFVVAGQLMAMQMGLGFASMIDPTNGVAVAVVSQFYVLLVTMLFLAMNGHLVLIDIVVESFFSLPVSAQWLGGDYFWTIANWGSWLFTSGLLIALPAVTAILVVNFAFGVMTRAAPQLNIFSLGFPFTLVFGIFIIWASLSGFLPQYQLMSEQAFAMVRSLIQG